MTPRFPPGRRQGGAARELLVCGSLAALTAFAGASAAAAQQRGSLTLRLEPSDELSRVIGQSPGRFSWSLLDRELRVGVSEAESAEVPPFRLCAVHVRAGETVESGCGDPISAGREELAGTAASGELAAGASAWDRLSAWIAPSDWRPTQLFVPAGAVDATRDAVTERALAGQRLGGDEAMVVLYPAPEAGAGEGGVRARFVLLLFERAP